MGAAGPGVRLAGILADTACQALLAGTGERPEADLGAWSRRVLARLGVQVDVEGEAAPGGLWVANHLSWLDPLALLSLRPASALAKAEVAEYPLVGRGALKAGLGFVRREDPASRVSALRFMDRKLSAGTPFLLFPEGTTTRGGTLAPLRTGGLRLAWRRGTPLTPLCLESPDPHYPWTGEEALLPHLAELLRRGGARLRVRVRPLMLPPAFPTEAAWVEAAVRAIDPRPGPDARCA